MAKKDKKTKKSTENAKVKAKVVSNMLEAKGFEMAHKIWLAGVGAYGKAYDLAAENVSKVNAQGSELFDELVKRGEEIEGDVRSRLKANPTLSKVSEQVSKVGEQVRDEVTKARGRVIDATGDMTDTVTKFQEEQRERLEARMERMREALGLEKFAAKNKAAKAEKAEDEAPVRAKKTVHKVAKKAPAKKPTAKAEAGPAVDANGRLAKPVGKADDLTQIKGVGSVLQDRLYKAGIFHFWQIAALKKAQIEVLEADMKFPGRVTRDNWKAQAKTLAKAVAA